MKNIMAAVTAREGGGGKEKSSRRINMVNTKNRYGAGTTAKTGRGGGLWRRWQAPRMITAAVLALLVCATWQSVSFAGGTNIVVDNRTGDNSIEVEVSVGGTPCMISADTGFRYNLDAPPDTVRVDARVSGDIYGYYDLSYEPEVNLADGGIIRITVEYSGLYGDAGIENAPDLDGVGTDGADAWDPDSYDGSLPDTGMEEIDLSGGEDGAGTLVIRCQPVNAFDEAVLTLVDEDYKTYRIPLHMEPYFFRARVKLPAGKYRESGIPEITFNESASRDSSLSYVWAHTGGAAFGGFFDIRAGEETSMEDLVVRTVKGGEIMDTDSRYYFNKKAYEEESVAKLEGDREFKEKNYQSLTLDGKKAGGEDEGAEPGFMEIAGSVFAMLLKAVPFLLMAVLATVGFVLYKRYKENNRI